MRKQYGMSGMGWMFVLAVIGTIVWLAMKIVPIYVDDGKMSNAMESIKAQPEVATKGNDEIKKMLLSRLAVEGIDTVNNNNFKEVVKIERTDRGFNMTVQYQNEVLLFANLHALVKFDKTIEVP